MCYERGCVINPEPPAAEPPKQDEKQGIAKFEDSVVSHLENIIESQQPDAVINSAK